MADCKKEDWFAHYGGDYFYYNNVTQGDGVVLWVPLEANAQGEEWEPEQFAVYYESPIMDISRKARVVTEFHSYEGLSGTFTVEEICLTDGLKVSEKINQSLGEIYALWQEQIQDYIGFRFGWMEYWGGAAHPIYGSRFMVLDRKTARQVGLEEFTGLFGEELCRIIAPYVEADSEWSAM